MMGVSSTPPSSSVGSTVIWKICSCKQFFKKKKLSLAERKNYPFDTARSQPKGRASDETAVVSGRGSSLPRGKEESQGPASSATLVPRETAGADVVDN